MKLADDFTPTPALSYAVKNLGATGGVMITSSHNPFNWNGVKYKAGYGGSGTPAIMKSIEGELDSPRLERPGGSVTRTDFKTPYIAAIENFVDLPAIRQAGFKFAIDVMYGAGRGVLKGIFDRNGMSNLEIRGQLEPAVPGHQSRAHRAAHCHAAGDRGARALPGRPGHRRRRRPPGRGRRRRQLRGFAQDVIPSSWNGS